MEAAARSSPSFRSLTSPATNSALAALNMTMSLTGPFAPSSIDIMMRRFSEASPPRTSSMVEREIPWSFASISNLST